MKRIVQIELTNFCNRKCHYCGQTNMTRPKGFMEPALVDRCIDVLIKIGQIDNVGLNHYGESLLHPDFINIVEKFNTNGITPWLFTNGDYISDNMIEKLAKLTFSSIVISSHMPKAERQAIQKKCYDAGLPAYWQPDYTPESLISIGNQVENVGGDRGKPPLKDPANQCAFLKNDWGIVLWNGDLVPCCIDYDAKGMFGNIMDGNSHDLHSAIFNICSQCPGHSGNTI